MEHDAFSTGCIVTLSGPNMDYLRVCLEWWDCHLKGQSNNVMEQPKIRVYVKDSLPPSRE